jgi:hypothetical protein
MLLIQLPISEAVSPSGATTTLLVTTVYFFLTFDTFFYLQLSLVIFSIIHSTCVMYTIERVSS